MKETKVSQIDARSIFILPILAAVVLFGLTFSSCKGCDKAEGKGRDNLVTDKDKPNGKYNPVTDKDKPDDKDNPVTDKDKPDDMANGGAIVEIQNKLEEVARLTVKTSRIRETVHSKWNVAQKAAWAKKKTDEEAWNAANNAIKPLAAEVRVDADNAEKLIKEENVKNALAAGGDMANTAKAIRLLALKVDMNARIIMMNTVWFTPEHKVAVDEITKTENALQKTISADGTVVLDIAEKAYLYAGGREKEFECYRHVLGLGKPIKNNEYK
jgi:hypothetical protein